jgi:hypothetical protein
MSSAATDLYVALMATIRERLDVVEKLSSAVGSDFSRAEAAAFHGRKLIEGIAFGCLVATQNGMRQVPRDAKGQWNAETILQSLEAKKITTFPSPSIVRAATKAERQSDDVNVTIEGVPERRISKSDLIVMYQRMHRWLHELNPYTAPDRADFYSKHGQQLWNDLAQIGRFIERHFISISGKGYFCVLRDSVDGLTKVRSLSKGSEKNAMGRDKLPNPLIQPTGRERSSTD